MEQPTHSAGAGSPVRVEAGGAASAAACDEYLLRQPGTVFYHSAKFRRFLVELLRCTDHTLVAWRGTRIAGMFPLMVQESQGRRVYNSLPYFGSWGGIVADDGEVYDALAAAYNDLSSREETLASTVICNPLSPWADRDATAFRHNLRDHRIAQITPLPAAGDGAGLRGAIEELIDPSARRNARKAEREGVVVGKDVTQFPRLCEMHQENIRAIGGTVKTDEFFRLVPGHFTPGDEYDLYVGRLDGRVVAGLLLFYFNDTVEYFTPASDHEARSLQPLSLILLEALAEASRRGFRRFNWGGTWESQTGVYRFKRKWGAEDHPYQYYTQLNDDDVRRWSRSAILERFPNFYVLPFTALDPEE